MPAVAHRLSANKDASDELVVDGWGYVHLSLDPTAPGNCHVEIGKGLAPMYAGDSWNFLAAPGTRIKVSTSSANNATWSAVVTETPWMHDIGSICHLLRAALGLR